MHFLVVVKLDLVFVIVLVVCNVFKKTEHKYALRTTHYALRTTHYALRTTHYALRTTHYALCTMHYALRTTHYTLRTTHYALRTTHYALFVLVLVRCQQLVNVNTIQ
jgi:hypothetical protein